MFRFSLILLCLLSLVFGGIKSQQDKIEFDLSADGVVEAVLNTTGLGLGTLTPSSNLEVMGTMGYGFSTVSANTDLTNLHSTVLVNSPLINVQLTLPDAATVPGRMYMIKHTTGNTYSTLTSSSNIDGDRALVLKPIPNSRAFPFVKVMSNGSTWHVLEYHNQSRQDIAASDNLVVWWSFDETPSTTFQDGSSLGNHGVIGGSADYLQVEGRVGKAVVGQNSRTTLLTLAHNSSTDLDSVSVGFWIKASASASVAFGNYSSVITKLNYSVAGWQVDFNNTGATPRQIRTRTDSSASSFNKTTSQQSIFDGNWYHLVYTANNGNINFYLNGASVATQTYNTGSGNTLSNSLGITLSIEPELFLDEVRIYSKALSASEVYQWFGE